jgi:hypothetical protein
MLGDVDSITTCLRLRSGELKKMLADSNSMAVQLIVPCVLTVHFLLFLPSLTRG